MKDNAFCSGSKHGYKDDGSIKLWCVSPQLDIPFTRWSFANSCPAPHSDMFHLALVTPLYGYAEEQRKQRYNHVSRAEQIVNEYAPFTDDTNRRAIDGRFIPNRTLSGQCRSAWLSTQESIHSHQTMRRKADDIFRLFPTFQRIPCHESTAQAHGDVESPLLIHLFISVWQAFSGNGTTGKGTKMIWSLLSVLP